MPDRATTRTAVIAAVSAVVLALITGLAVYGVMSSRLASEVDERQQMEERVAELDEEVGALAEELERTEEERAPETSATEDAGAMGASEEDSGDGTSGGTADGSSDGGAGGSADEAEPGRYFCYVRDGIWEGAQPVLVVDYAILLTGAEAAAEAAARGEESPPPNDYFIVNDNPMLRQIPADPTQDVNVVSRDGGMVDPGGYTMTFGQWFDVLIGMSGSDFVRDRPYWITIEDGVIVELREQFFP